MRAPQYWLSYAYNEGLGAYIAIASTRHPVLGDDETDVAGTAFCQTEDECKAWFEEFKAATAEGREPPLTGLVGT